MSFAQPLPICDSLVESAGGQYGYTLREGDSRCEGLYKSRVSATELQLVSISIGEMRYTNAVKSLAISLPASTHPDIGPIHVRGMAIPLKTYYRMDAVMAPGEAMRWPLQDVVHPSSLRSRDLGVLAWAEIDGKRLYIPVQVRPLNAEGDDRPGTEVIVKILSTSHLEKLLWRFKGDLAWRTANGDGRTVRSGRPVSFRPLRHAEGADSIVELEFVGKVRNSDRRAFLSFSLWRPSS